MLRWDIAKKRLGTTALGFVIPSFIRIKWDDADWTPLTKEECGGQSY